jgi:hypothetical protein
VWLNRNALSDRFCCEVLLHVAAAANSVVCDGQVEDQAPAARRILEEAADRCGSLCVCVYYCRT